MVRIERDSLTGINTQTKKEDTYKIKKKKKKRKSGRTRFVCFLEINYDL